MVDNYCIWLIIYTLHENILSSGLYASHALRLAKPISVGRRHSSYKTWYKYCFRNKVAVKLIQYLNWVFWFKQLMCILNCCKTYDRNLLLHLKIRVIYENVLQNFQGLNFQSREFSWHLIYRYQLWTILKLLSTPSHLFPLPWLSTCAGFLVVRSCIQRYKNIYFHTNLFEFQIKD